LGNCVLRVENIDKSFGRTKILHGISLSVDKGDVCGLIGQNGAGKTTLLRLISGLMKPSCGSIIIHTERPYIGYMPQSCRFDDRSTVLNTIKFFAAIKQAKVGQSLELCRKLELDTTKKVKHLSPGQQKKLQIVIAMIGNPDFFILDEPTAGLDPKATFEMTEIIKSIRADGRTILVSSHILSDMDEICTHAAIIEKGRLICNHQLKDSFIVKTSPVPIDVLVALQGRYSFQTNEDNTILTLNAGKDTVSGLVRELNAHSVDIFGVSAFNLKNIVRRQMDISRKEGEN
jgi:ABC-type multidrug transport system ATPase subunit